MNKIDFNKRDSSIYRITSIEAYVYALILLFFKFTKEL